MDTGGDTGAGRGLFASVRRLAETLIAALQTRLELLSTEAEEHVLRLVRVLMIGALALAFVVLGVLMATLFVVIAFWDSHRLVAAGGLALVYLGGGLLLARRAQRELRSRPRLFAASLAELGKDRQQLRGDA